MSTEKILTTFNEALALKQDAGHLLLRANRLQQDAIKQWLLTQPDWRYHLVSMAQVVADHSNHRDVLIRVSMVALNDNADVVFYGRDVSDDTPLLPIEPGLEVHHVYTFDQALYNGGAHPFLAAFPGLLVPGK